MHLVDAFWKAKGSCERRGSPLVATLRPTGQSQLGSIRSRLRKGGREPAVIGAPNQGAERRARRPRGPKSKLPPASATPMAALRDGRAASFKDTRRRFPRVREWTRRLWPLPLSRLCTRLLYSLPGRSGLSMLLFLCGLREGVQKGLREAHFL